MGESIGAAHVGAIAPSRGFAQKIGHIGYWGKVTGRGNLRGAKSVGSNIVHISGRV